MSAPLRLMDRDEIDAQSWLLDRLDDLWLLLHWCDKRPRMHPVTKQPWTCVCPMVTADACYRDRYPRPFDADGPSPGDFDYETCECHCHEWEHDEEEDPPCPATAPDAGTGHTLRCAIGQHREDLPHTADGMQWRDGEAPRGFMGPMGSKR